jgi:hypothetical protein
VEWITKFKLSQTLLLEMSSTRLGMMLRDMNRTARMRHWEEDLIWRNCLEIEERNLNQRTRQFDIREAYLRRREHRCDRREADLYATRLRGRARGKRSQ